MPKRRKSEHQKMKERYRKMWRTIVKARKPYCEWCRDVGRPQRSQILQADHITGKHTDIQDFELENGVTLCKSCHMGVKHMTSGGALEFYRWADRFFGVPKMEALRRLRNYTAKANPDMLQRKIEQLETEYAKLKNRGEAA